MWCRCRGLVCCSQYPPILRGFLQECSLQLALCCFAFTKTGLCLILTYPHNLVVHGDEAVTVWSTAYVRVTDPLSTLEHGVATLKVAARSSTMRAPVNRLYVVTVRAGQPVAHPWVVTLGEGTCCVYLPKDHYRVQTVRLTHCSAITIATTTALNMSGQK